LTTIAKLRKGGEDVITVVGCGGDRDKTKRPIMAQVACDLSTKVFLTSDNPRSEDPNQIIKDMEEGLTSAAKRKYINIVDRKEAIKAAVSFAKPGDIILVAGKGHEKYQDIKGVKYDFDDKAILKNLFNEFEK
jgi:UDP-N-acetylmuramoyl-L-alanyl-D-glutamate--2,6-diaminopimelate ligase